MRIIVCIFHVRYHTIQDFKELYIPLTKSQGLLKFMVAIINSDLHL